MAANDGDAQLLTVQETAQLLKLGLTRTYELIGLGILPSVKIGALRRIPRKAVLDLAQNGLEAPAAAAGGRS